jgi:hypothetical protein
MAGNVLFDAAKKKRKNLTPAQRKAKVKSAVSDAIQNSDGSMAKSMQAGMAMRSAYDKRKAAKKKVKKV